MRKASSEGRAGRLGTLMGAAFGAVLAGSLLAGPSLAADKPDLAALKAGYKRPAAIPFPANNPFTPAKADLGRALFFDPRLSGAATMSCASCHNPALSWGDGLPTGVGADAQRLARRSPTILNLAWADSLMWDGRAASLEEQAVGPIKESSEMNQTMPKLLTSLGTIAGYRAAFSVVFPNEPISEVTIGKAIATFERTVVSGQAPFDRWIEGDEQAIDPAAKRGFVTFNTTANCAACHSGWRLTDDSFHDIGLPSTDPGRGRIVPGVEPLRHAFKTPSLRNVAERAPYMHDGSIRSLTDVVRHYNNGYIARPSLSAEMVRLNLSADDARDLVAFMKTLSSTDPVVTVPVLPTEMVD